MLFPSTNAVLTIGFQPITYQVSEVMGKIEVCFEVDENTVLDVAAQAILNTVSGSAIGMTQFNPHQYLLNNYYFFMKSNSFS